MNRRPGNHKSRRRAGAALVEAALVLSALLFTIFALFDLGLAVLRLSVLSAAADHALRYASLHGEYAEADDQLGPNLLEGNAGDGTPLAAVMGPPLITVDHANVLYSVAWPDGTNNVGDRVMVEVTYPHSPLFSFIAGSTGWPLQVSASGWVEH